MKIFDNITVKLYSLRKHEKLAYLLVALLFALVGLVVVYMNVDKLAARAATFVVTSPLLDFLFH